MNNKEKNYFELQNKIKEANFQKYPGYTSDIKAWKLGQSHIIKILGYTPVK